MTLLFLRHLARCQRCYPMLRRCSARAKATVLCATPIPGVSTSRCGVALSSDFVRALGAPIGWNVPAMRAYILRAAEKQQLFFARVASLHPVVALRLLALCGVPRFTFLARVSPPHLSAQAAEVFDSYVVVALHAILRRPLSPPELALACGLAASARACSPQFWGCVTRTASRMCRRGSTRKRSNESSSSMNASSRTSRLLLLFFVPLLGGAPISGSSGTALKTSPGFSQPLQLHLSFCARGHCGAATSSSPNALLSLPRGCPTRRWLPCTCSRATVSRARPCTTRWLWPCSGSSRPSAFRAAPTSDVSTAPPTNAPISSYRSGLSQWMSRSFTHAPAQTATCPCLAGRPPPLRLRKWQTQPASAPPSGVPSPPWPSNPGGPSGRSRGLFFPVWGPSASPFSLSRCGVAMSSVLANWHTSKPLATPSRVCGSRCRRSCFRSRPLLLPRLLRLRRPPSASSAVAAGAAPVTEFFFFCLPTLMFGVRRCCVLLSDFSFHPCVGSAVYFFF